MEVGRGSNLVVGPSEPIFYDIGRRNGRRFLLPRAATGLLYFSVSMLMEHHKTKEAEREGWNEETKKARRQQRDVNLLRYRYRFGCYESLLRAWRYLSPVSYFFSLLNLIIG